MISSISFPSAAVYHHRYALYAPIFVRRRENRYFVADPHLAIDCSTFDEAQHILDLCAGGAPPCPTDVFARLYVLPSGGVFTVHCEAFLHPQESRIYIAEQCQNETYRLFLPPPLLKKYPALRPHQLSRISVVQRELGVLLGIPGSSDPSYVRTAAFLQRLTDWLAGMYRLEEVSSP